MPQYLPTLIRHVNGDLAFLDKNTCECLEYNWVNKKINGLVDLSVSRPCKESPLYIQCL